MLHIIVNPGSSAGQGMRRWREVEPLFSGSKKPCRVHFPLHGQSVAEIVRKVTQKCSDEGEPCSLVVLGGDGTLNITVNAIADFQNTRLGFIPVGSANDLAKSIGLSSDIPSVVRRILKEEVVRTCDVGEVVFHNRFEADSHSQKRRLFNISCGIGYDAQICHDANRTPVKHVLNAVHLGGMVYVAQAAKLIVTAPMVPCKITADTGFSCRTGSMLFSVIMNRKYEGGGFPFCPEASAEDGILDLCAVTNVRHRADFIRLAPKVLHGTHVNERIFQFGRAKSFDIRSKSPLWIHTDGEVHCKSSHITVRLAKETLKMLV